MTISRILQSKIHIGRQQLGLDDASYRALLTRIAGVRSSTALTDHKAGAVLREFERLGFKPKVANSKGKPRNFSARSMPAMITKIEAQLADMGLPWSYADGIASQMYDIQRCAWVRDPKQLKAIISALHVEQEKRGLLTRFNDLMETARAGHIHAKWQAIVDELPEGWQRRRKKLNDLIAALEGDLLHAELNSAACWEE